MSCTKYSYLGNIPEMPGHPTKEWHRNVDKKEILISRQEGNINQQTRRKY
jgi:hypothetical protein